jgi:prepilin-type N-terminal cleavage/methylation domain-containing protein
MRNKAFTLAEVLITLAIIGVVAALTISTVVRNYQKQQTLVKLKKVFSALSNTTNLAIAEHGPITGWKVGENATAQAAVDFANTYLIPYLKVSKNCESKTSGDCEFKMTHLSGATTLTFGPTSTRFFLNDGTLLRLVLQMTPILIGRRKSD